LFGGSSKKKWNFPSECWFNYLSQNRISDLVNCSLSLMIYIDLFFIVVILSISYNEFTKNNWSLSSKFFMSLLGTAMVGAIWLIIFLFYPVEVSEQRYPSAKYEVLKSNDKVVFTLKEREKVLSRNDYFIYKNANDTSRVYLKEVEKYNRFGGNIEDKVKVETVKSQ